MLKVFEGIESPGNKKSNSSISSWQVKIFEKKLNIDYQKKIQIMNEANLLSYLEHENIQKFKDFVFRKFKF